MPPSSLIALAAKPAERSPPKPPGGVRDSLAKSMKARLTDGSSPQRPAAAKSCEPPVRRSRNDRRPYPVWPSPGRVKAGPDRSRRFRRPQKRPGREDNVASGPPSALPCGTLSRHRQRPLAISRVTARRAVTLPVFPRPPSVARAHGASSGVRKQPESASSMARSRTKVWRSPCPAATSGSSDPRRLDASPLPDLSDPSSITTTISPDEGSSLRHPLEQTDLSPIESKEPVSGF